MLKNYIIIALRNMKRNKLFTFVNIIGLSASLACCILLFMYSNRELGYDAQNKDVYRLTTFTSQKNGEESRLGTSSVPLTVSVEQELPGAERAVRACNTDFFGTDNLITNNDQSSYIKDGYYVDSSFFNVLKFDIIAGNANHPFNNSSSVVLEKDWAKKLFGDDDPLGKRITISTLFGPTDLEVSAVYDKETYDCHINPSFLIPMSNPNSIRFFRQDQSNWLGSNPFYTYLKVTPGSDIGEMTSMVNDLLKANGGEVMEQTGIHKTVEFQPVQDIHTDNAYTINVPGVVNLVFIKVLIMIGMLVLVLACVNYINLATAQAGNRALEVGVRKVMGISRSGLIVQFLGESFLIVFISLVLSMLFAWLGLPYFNKLIDRPLTISQINWPLLATCLAGFLVITGLVAGLYPAFYLAAFKPARVLKGRSGDQIGTVLLRKSLVVIQFVISIALISSILIISQQVEFIRNKELGFDKKSKLIVSLSSDEARHQYEVLVQKFRTNSMVKNVTGASEIPGSYIPVNSALYKKGQTAEDAVHIYQNEVDSSYFNVMDIKKISGRLFENYAVDTALTRVVVSEEAIKQFGFTPDNAIGEIVYSKGWVKTQKFEIIGVVGDIHQVSLHRAIEPMMYTLGNANAQGDNRQYYSNIIINTETGDFQGLITQLESQWKNVVKDSPFTFYTLDDHLMLQYAKDFNTFNLILYFGFISLLISCLGLYAISMFLAERRFREIGIRKVFGAEVKNIVIMVSGDLSKLIVVAFILSVPLSVWAMNTWLETFAYRIHQGSLTYIIAGVISLAIGWLTISYQSFRAAMTNPVKILREE